MGSRSVCQKLLIDSRVCVGNQSIGDQNCHTIVTYYGVSIRLPSSCAIVLLTSFSWWSKTKGLGIGFAGFLGDLLSQPLHILTVQYMRNSTRI